MTRSRKLWIALGVLIVLSPLGLMVPRWLGAGSAWGEWSPEELGHLWGRVPAGVAKLSHLWRAPLPDYGVAGQESAGLHTRSAWYTLSAVAGAAAVALLAWLVGRWLVSNERRNPPLDA